MNAYELAEKLNDAVNKNEKHVTLDIQAMLMLRQQADRIAELEKELEKTSEAAMQLREIYVNRIAELQSNRRKAWD